MAGMEIEKDLGLGFHSFSLGEKTTLQKSLLSWFDICHRDLPWRKITTDDPNERAYAVWVSEIMLQQTQVATVTDYYNKWMKKWPTLQDLAGASVEEVNAMWSGLGYYSRGRRLLEGAQKVVQELNGNMPRTAQNLQKLLPGVGRYTAGAIASIAFGEVTGLVDGNVMRVLSRLRMIGAYITQPAVTDKFWEIANDIVDQKRPGDFNQAMMELGATVCTPRNPTCDKCPVKSLCRANAKTEKVKSKTAITITKLKRSPKGKEVLPDIECLIPDCELCLPADQPWDTSLGVHNYPRKPKKADAKQEDHNVLIIQGMENECPRDLYLVCQRPKKGLLAGLWEFPMQLCKDSNKKPKSFLHDDFNLDPGKVDDVQECGMVTHVFSHIRHTYHVYSMKLKETETDNHVLDESGKNFRWVSADDMEDTPMSTGMRKVFKVYRERMNTEKKKGQKRKADCEIIEETKKQLSIAAFFKATRT